MEQKTMNVERIMEQKTLSAMPGDAKKARKEKGKKINKPAKAPKLPGEDVRKRRKKAQQSYAIYIFKVLKQIHPELTISKRGMDIMNSFMNDVFDRIATEATRLLRGSRKRTLSSGEIETSVRLMLPGELSKHAVSEGTKAVTKYNMQTF
mmetsp:Transcript_46991/g.102259  ORF Transcript_46991/g.102259 Transcript_46991/m.102259 type:complete len:150 (+) Transcript_46991:93-542(+)